MAKVKTLPLPGFVNLKNAAEWGFTPNNMDLFGKAEEWRKQHGVKPCGSDKVKVGVLLIDAQNDFCDPKGTLYVGGHADPKATSNNGAIEDNKRVADFLYKNAGLITTLTCTLDTHFPFQIFFPSFWKDANGQPPAPFTEITTDDLKKGKFTINPGVAHFISKGNIAWLQNYVKHYTASLEKAGKYKLTIWPFHCLLGTPGYSLNGLIAEAAIFHSFLRCSPGMKEVKGGNFLTENYSVLSPEVVVDHENRAIAQKNVEFIKTLLEMDHVIITGQAASHCVASSIGDLLDAINAKDPDLAKKCTILTDGTSAVTVPDGKGGYFVDCTPQAEAAFKRFSDAGMTLAKTTDPIESYVKGL
jgi:nicotinamidase-related amidase